MSTRFLVYHHILEGMQTKLQQKEDDEGKGINLVGGMDVRKSIDHQIDLGAYWDMDSPDYECDCPGPPPEFRLPPPPRPPFLQEGGCTEDPIPDLETCEAVPVIDAEYHSSPAIPSIAVIVVCSVLLLVMVLIASVLVWKHKRKMQNFLPCKTSPQNRCDVTNGNGVIYEDLTNIHPRAIPNHCPPGQTAPPIELIDVKTAANYNNAGFTVLGNSSVFICPPPRPEPYLNNQSQDLYNPVYEELSNGSEERPGGSGDSEADSVGRANDRESEDEFAEDELSLVEYPGANSGPPQEETTAGSGERGPNSGTSSLQGSTGNDLCRDLDSSDQDDRKLSETDSFLVGAGDHETPPPPEMFPTRNLSLPPTARTMTGRRPREHGSRSSERRPRSLDRRRGWRSPRKMNGSYQTQPPQHHQNDVKFARQDMVEEPEFHEGLLLDALAPYHYQQQLLQQKQGRYPSVLTPANFTESPTGRRTSSRLNLVPFARNNNNGSGYQQDDKSPVPSVAHRLPYAYFPPPILTELNHKLHPAMLRNHQLALLPQDVNPYESVPVLNHLQQGGGNGSGNSSNRTSRSSASSGGGYTPISTPNARPLPEFSTFRPGKGSQDSFGSDSGFSNNTSGGRASSRSAGGGSRKDNNRLSVHSVDMEADNLQDIPQAFYDSRPVLS